jgi:hypothetical protein
MITAKSIREKCEADILKLQDTCNHPSSTDCEESWAVGHMTGRVLKICDVCEKKLGVL